MNNEISLFSGVYAAALTPMHEDLSCNCEALVNHCTDLMSRGCKGVLLFGTTGEGASFSAQERIQAIKSVCNLGIDPQKLLIGISCPAIDDAVQLANASVDLNCAAALIVPPFYYKNVDDAGVIAFYREVIKRVNYPDLKIFLYHIPQHSGVPITLRIIKTLREEFPNTILGIKESEGNLALTKDILSAFPGFKVFVGNELQISDAVRLGAAGGITGMVNAFPELICSLYEYGLDSQKLNNNERAQSIAQEIRKYPIIPAIKAFVERQKGSAWHVLRPPLHSLSEQQRQALIDALQ